MTNEERDSEDERFRAEIDRLNAQIAGLTVLVRTLDEERIARALEELCIELTGIAGERGNVDTST